MSFRKLRAFVRKDYLVESSYKMAFVLSILGSFFPLITFFFIGELVDRNSGDVLTKYGGSYFSFALIGLAFSRYFQLAISTFSSSMQRAQMAGCLEAILSSRTDPRAVVIYSSVYSFLSSAAQLIFMFLAGVLLFGFSFSAVNVPAFLLTLVFALFTFIGMGILSAAGTIVFKKGEPFAWFFGAFSSLFGGVYFPIEIMPDWLESVSVIVPIHYALEALRLSILKGYSIDMISNHLFVLGGMAVVLFTLSIQAFQWAVEKGKRDGTLIHY